MTDFLETAPLVNLAEVRCDTGRLPKDRGIYGLFFLASPGQAPKEGCLIREGRWLMYIGTAGANLSRSGTLRNRLGDHHLGGNERRSTVCQTLAARMPAGVGPAIARDERGKVKMHSSLEGVEWLRGWMDSHIAVCWTCEARPGDVEEALVRRYAPPLNINFSAHPFVTQRAPCDC